MLLGDSLYLFTIIPNIPVLHPYGASYRCSNCSRQFSQEKSSVVYWTNGLEQ
jgi:hypothetical protein